MQDVRVKQGADVTSDHHLLTIKLKLKLKKNKIEGMENRKKYNVNLLREVGIQELYRMKLSNRFKALQDILENETNIDSQWHHIKSALTST